VVVGIISSDFVLRACTSASPHIPAGFSIFTGFFSSPNPLNEFSFGGLDFGESHAIGE
jgi:hypothetical protein